MSTFNDFIYSFIREGVERSSNTIIAGYHNLGDGTVELKIRIHRNDVTIRVSMNTLIRYAQSKGEFNNDELLSELDTGYQVLKFRRIRSSRRINSSLRATGEETEVSNTDESEYGLALDPVDFRQNVYVKENNVVVFRDITEDTFEGKRIFIAGTQISVDLASVDGGLETNHIPVILNNLKEKGYRSLIGMQATNIKHGNVYTIGAIAIDCNNDHEGGFETEVIYSPNEGNYKCLYSRNLREFLAKFKPHL